MNWQLKQKVILVKLEEKKRISVLMKMKMTKDPM
jgi:hypothetical protein